MPYRRKQKRTSHFGDGLAGGDVDGEKEATKAGASLYAVRADVSCQTVRVCPCGDWSLAASEYAERPTMTPDPVPVAALEGYADWLASEARERREVDPDSDFAKALDAGANAIRSSLASAKAPSRRRLRGTCPECGRKDAALNTTTKGCHGCPARPHYKERPSR